MSNQILVPSLGESITEATVSKWLKKVGEEVDSDEPLVELETDKVNVEVPSPLAGTLSSIKVKEGDTVEVGALLGVISSEKNKVLSSQKIVPITRSKKREKRQDKTEKEEELLVFDEKESSNNGQKIDQPLILDQQVKEEVDKTLVLNQETSEGKKYSQDENLPKKLSPAVRKIVSEKKINLEEVQGTGKDGRILKGDLIELMSQSPQPSERKIKY